MRLSNNYSKYQDIFISDSIFTVFLKTLLLLTLYALVWFAILSYFNIDGPGNSTVKEFSGFTKALLIFVIAPVTETLLFQALIIHLVFKLYKKKHRKHIAIIASTLAFGLTHIYSIYYFIYAIGIGFGFARFYLINSERKSYPILLTILLHTSFNGIGYMLSILFE